MSERDGQQEIRSDRNAAAGQPSQTIFNHHAIDNEVHPETIPKHDPTYREILGLALSSIRISLCYRNVQ